MEKINISELLKDCPKGMELDCTIWDSEAKVFFKRVLNDDFAYPIEVTVKYNNTEYSKSFTKYGAFNDLSYCKCVIFPKGKTTWEGFHRPFKDGDVIFTHANCLKVGLGNTWISIYQENRNGGVATYVDYAEDGSDYYSDIDGDKAFLCMENDILRQRLATEEEKAKLFKAIKDNGYRWNSETKTLEKLPKFKVGDIIKRKCLDNINSIEITSVTPKMYTSFKDGSFQHVEIIDEDDELALDKFDITTLKPFESRVLVRDNNCDEWEADIFGRYSNGYITLGGIRWKQCIPFEGNEHLLGTTDDCDEFFKF